MSPLQREILTLLVHHEEGLDADGIAIRLTRPRHHVYGHSVAGAFGARRSWVVSSTGKLGGKAVLTISDDGRKALAAEDERMEAEHPMGRTVPGSFIVVVDEVHVIRRRPILVTGVGSADEAEATARQRCDDGAGPENDTVTIERRCRTRPMRELDRLEDEPRNPAQRADDRRGVKR